MASFEWPLSKMQVINSALSQCGDNLVAVADDGSDEWLVASPAYERALAYMMERHGWVQATEIRTLAPAVNVPADPQYDTAFDFPPDLVHLTLVEVDDRTADWELLNNQILVNAGAGTLKVTIRGVFSTNADPTFGTPTFVIALQAFVMSGIYRGLHEDLGEADKLWNSGKAILMEAETRQDLQKPKRSMFNSRLVMTRRVRRPWLTRSRWGGLN